MNVVPAERGDHVAAVGNQFDESLAAQGQERLADGCDADTQVRRRLVEADEVTRANAPGHDQVADVHGDVVRQLGSAAQGAARWGS